MHHDLQEAQARIKNNHAEGKTIKEKLREMKRFTAGKLFNAKTCRVGQSMLTVYEENLDRRVTTRYEVRSIENHSTPIKSKRRWSNANAKEGDDGGI